MHKFALVSLLLVAACDPQTKSQNADSCAELAMQERATSNYNGPKDFPAMQHRIAKKIVYPKKARYAGQQGDVCLRLRIDREGVLRSYKIVYTSHYPLLDEAAIHAAKDASPYPIASEDFFGDHNLQEFLIPIHFSLHD